MKGKSSKIIIGVLIAAIIVVGGLVALKLAAPSASDAGGSTEAKEMPAGTMTESATAVDPSDPHFNDPDRPKE